MWRCAVGRVAAAAALVAAVLGPGAGQPAAALAVLSATPTGPCGPARQPCTWNFGQAQAYPAQSTGREGAGVLVAVVDTWIDFSHPDFSQRVIDAADCLAGGGACEDRTYAPDACVHGTHVAGTIASSSYGMAPAARILAVQVLAYDPSNGECSGTAADVAAGIRFAVAHRAQVVNLSLGGLVPGLFQDSGVTAAIHAAAAAGAVVVVAAGNDSVPLTDSYGADALLVAATGPNGSLASYSDRDGSVALAAPGGDDGLAGLSACDASTCIRSTEPHDTYGLLEGTSMAAPHVAGTAALLLAQNPARGRADVVHALEATARPLNGAGHGRLDASAALALEAGTGSGPAGSATTTAGAGGPATTLAGTATGAGGPVAAGAGAGGGPATTPTSRPAAARPTTTSSPRVSVPPSTAARRAAGTGSSSSGSGSLALPAAVAAALLVIVSGALGGLALDRRRRSQRSSPPS